jgi:nucleotide-binding universal stress UspA family protein
VKTILAAIDFSPVSRRVERAALALARAIGDRVLLFHAVVPPPVIANELVPLGGGILQWTDGVERAAARHLRRVRQRWTSSGVAVDTLCTSGPAARQVLDAAREAAASYIVLGSHGHTAFCDLVAGSTASGVLKRAECPVVVVPPARKSAASRRRRK